MTYLANRQRHGHATGNKHSPEYRAWSNAKSRCVDPTNPGFKNYGGRGIRMCKRWRNSFPAFLADMGRRPAGLSLERRENDKDYNPDNCIWGERLTQANNRRANVFMSFRGERLTMAQWARKLGVPKERLRGRRRYGWSVRRILTTPLLPPCFAASGLAAAKQNRKPISNP